MTRSDPAVPGPHADAAQDRFVAVVVTFNREDMVGQCLDALQAQTRAPDAVVVIDNASTDASGRIAEDHPLEADVVHLHRNVGGSGGFAAGMARALERHDADWLWVMDDDTIPRPTALAALVDTVAAAPARLSVLSSRAVWTDGRDHPMNRSRDRIGADAAERADAAVLGARPIRTASYVSALLSGSEVRRLGLPIADYFIWSDDFEHTGRLLRHGRGLAVPASVVEHRTKVFATAQASPGGRFYYDVRNRIWALTRTRSFAPWEAALYGANTLRGWILTLLRRRRDGLFPIGLRGLQDAIGHGPRPAAQVLAADPEVADLVRRIERHAGR